MTTAYAVYVSDDNGWLEGCPDYCGVFFDDTPDGGRYVGPRDSEFGGHVESDSLEAAEQFRGLLMGSGDWASKRDGEERRPSYDMAEVR